MSYKIITIARQFGSRGGEVGIKLSKELGIPLYDRNLVEMAAEKMGLSHIDLAGIDESALNVAISGFHIPYRTTYSASYGMTLNDSTHLTQTKIIEVLAKKGPCIIVGRCADFVLRGNPDVLTVFIGASMEKRIKYVMEDYQLTQKEAVAKIKSADKGRKNYYEHYTQKKWGDVSSFHMTMNIGDLGMKQTVSILKTIYEAK